MNKSPSVSQWWSVSGQNGPPALHVSQHPPAGTLQVWCRSSGASGPVWMWILVCRSAGERKSVMKSWRKSESAYSLTSAPVGRPQTVTIVTHHHQTLPVSDSQTSDCHQSRSQRAADPGRGSWTGRPALILKHHQQHISYELTRLMDINYLTW